MSLINHDSITERINKIVSGDISAIPINAIRAYFHHMTVPQREILKDVNINVPVHPEYAPEMSLATFMGKISTRGFETYISSETPPLFERDSTMTNANIFTHPIDNKSFIDKFASPNETFSTYTDPAKYKVSDDMVLIDASTGVTHVKSFAEVLACKILSCLQDPQTSLTLSFVLHNLFASVAEKEGRIHVKTVKNVVYANSMSVFSAESVKIDQLFRIQEHKREVLEPNAILASKMKVNMSMRFVFPEIVRFPEGVTGDKEKIARVLNELVHSVISLVALDKLYQSVVAMKVSSSETVKFCGGITTRGCHYHAENARDPCPYANVSQIYDKDVSCKCGSRRCARAHYDLAKGCAGFAQCNCQMMTSFALSRFCDVGVQESRYLARSAANCDSSVPERLIGKPFGVFVPRQLSEEDAKHLVTYNFEEKLSGPGFVRKISSVSSVFTDLTDVSLAKLHRRDAEKPHNDDLAHVLASSAGRLANFNIAMRPCAIKSQFGFSVKFELSRLILNGLTSSRQGAFAEPTDSFDEDEDATFSDTPVRESRIRKSITKAPVIQKAPDLPTEKEIEFDEADVEGFDGM